MAPRLETREASAPLLGREEGLLGAVLRFWWEGLGVRTAHPVLHLCLRLSWLNSLREGLRKL